MLIVCCLLVILALKNQHFVDETLGAFFNCLILFKIVLFNLNLLQNTPDFNPVHNGSLLQKHPCPDDAFHLYGRFLCLLWPAQGVSTYFQGDDQRVAE